MRTKRALSCLFAVAALLFAGCGSEPSAPSRTAGRIQAFASIPPVAALVERIGGDRVRVETLLSPGQGPHTFAPTPKQAMALGEASVYFHVGGFAFEKELAQRIGENFPSLEIVDTGKGIARNASPHHHEHDTHGHAHEDEADPHIWMSPPLLQTMARTIADTLKATDPDHAATYDTNLNETLTALKTLDEDLRAQLAPFKGKAFYIYHPALGYFAEAYGLHQESVEVGGKKPTPRQLQELVEHAKDDGVRVIFVQPQFDQRSAESIAEAIGGAVVPLDPLREDVFANLGEIGTQMAEAFGAEKSP